MAIRISNSVRRLSGVGVVVAAVLASLIGGAAPADAADTTPVTPAGNSCSLDLSTGNVTCVPNGQDLNAAVLKEQGARVVVSSNARGTTPALLGPNSVQTLYIQSQLYDDVGYGGSLFQITNASPCNGSTVYSLSNLSSYGWSGRVSSFKSFSLCKTKVWQGYYESGAAYGYNTNASSIGALNDQVNSASMK